MAVSSVNCVYWEWQRDDGGFSPYLPSNSNAIEAANHAGLGGHNSGSYTIDFARMIQRKNATGFERQVQRQLIVLPSTPDITAYWTWKEHGSNFVLYDIQSSVDIELAFLNGYPSLDLSKCTSRLPYTIDFGKMEQTRHHYNTRRRIQRCLLPVGFSLQNLLALAPGLTGSASLASGGGVTMPHSTSGTGGGGFAAFPGYGSGPVPTPAMMNSGMPSGPPAGMVNFAPSVPPSASYGGHVMKSGGISTSTPYSLPGPTPSLSTTHTSKSGVLASSSSTINSMTTGAPSSFPSAPGGHVAVAKSITSGGLTSKGSARTSGRKTRTLAVLGAAIPAPVSSTSHTAHAAPISTAAAIHVPSYTGTGSTSTSSSAFTHPPPPSSAKVSLASATTSTGAISPQKRRRKNKTASNYTGHSSGAATSTASSVTASTKGGSSTSTVVAVKMEKSKARGRRREKKGAAAKSGRRSKDYGDETSKYARKKKKLKKGEDGPCPICMSQLSEDSGFGDEDDQDSTPSALNVCKLRKCGHMLHHPCLVMYIKNSSNSGFQCPTCKKSYGVKTGDMPDGQMSVRTLPLQQLPGHEGYGTIEITYNFRPGVYNGRRYNVSAFPRICYLPDSPKGQKVLKLLRVAWERRLTFTIGTSVTSGMTNTVVWNEIHHKTTIQNYSGHGYPDPNYLDRVMLELAAQGVTEDSGESDNEQGSSSSSSY